MREKFRRKKEINFSRENEILIAKCEKIRERKI
jgi:hypothetical protein